MSNFKLTPIEKAFFDLYRAVGSCNLPDTMAFNNKAHDPYKINSKKEFIEAWSRDPEFGKETMEDLISSIEYWKEQARKLELLQEIIVDD
jgi:hypothetical protein